MSELTLERIQRDTIATLDPLIRSQLDKSPYYGSTTGVEFVVADKDSVSIILYDVLGSSVTKIFKALLNSGRYLVKLNSLGLESGVYYFRIAIGSKVQTKRIIILK
ncbi:MAG: T9SS type A sorting domain-containing protein [Bacteroidota bacterium]